MTTDLRFDSDGLICPVKLEQSVNADFVPL